MTNNLYRLCTQTAVYWGNPVSDGSNVYTFDDPIEISCFLIEKTQLIRDNNGNEISSKAIVYVLQDMDEEGYLYLGELADLESDPTPDNTDGARQIVNFEKSKDLHSDEYIRRVYLK
jgi:hypothetical protein